MFELYIGSATTFIQPSFGNFNALYEAIHNAIPIRWVTNEFNFNSSRVEYLIFILKDDKVPATSWDHVIKQEIPIIKATFTSIINSMKV